jgi:hypothetical protein
MKHSSTSDETNDDDEDGEKGFEQPRGRRDTLAPPEDFRNPHETAGVRNLSPNFSCSGVSIQSTDPIHTRDSWDEDEGEQDIQEVWFPGCHAVSLSIHTICVAPTDRSRTLVEAGPLTLATTPL